MNEIYMRRCLELAELGRGRVAPNPMVGAVLVYEDRIIGEGYHEKYGEAHAEVNCIKSVREEDHDLISSSILYVSLEPCVHFGKTPPCADLIIEKKIPNIVIGCRDPFIQVNGKGIEKLVGAGVEVKVGVLEQEAKELNRRFFVFHQEHRPYIILKWAETFDGRIGSETARLLISGEQANRLVHKWRSEESSILVGTNTALVDDPELTTRHWPGANPVRLVVDMDLSLPSHLKLFDGKAKTMVFNTKKQEERDNLLFYQVTEDVSLVHQVMNALYQMKIQSVIVEGGAKLLQSFIDEGCWDEVRTVCSRQLAVGSGIAAPRLENARMVRQEEVGGDVIRYYEKAAG